MHLDDEMKIFSGQGNPALTQAVCDYLGISVGAAKVERFPDSEKMVKCLDDVRGRNCFIVQPTCAPVDANLMELLIFIDALVRASARCVTVVIPYFGYARQDRKDEGRVPITAKLVANLITSAGANRVLAIDLHTQQVQGFFDIPVDHLSAEPVIGRYFRHKKIDKLTVVSPDVGNTKVASKYASALGGELAIVFKRRLNASKVESKELIGSVEGRNIIMFDDMISTGGTICNAASLVKERGARKVYVAATHGVFSGDAVRKLAEAPIDEIVVTDTIPMSDEVKSLGRVTVLSVAELLGEAIKRIHRNESVSSLFDNW
jgi:ribose-phosphate pyrophosphokinase